MIEKKIISVAVMFFLVLRLLMLKVRKQSGKKGIISIIVNEYFIEEGMDEPVVESIQRFNEAGELIEIKEFNKKEEVKRWEKYVYDDDGNAGGTNFPG